MVRFNFQSSVFRATQPPFTALAHLDGILPNGYSTAAYFGPLRGLLSSVVSAFRVSAFPGNLMKPKYLCAFSLLFLGAAPAFSQSTTPSVTLNVIPSRSVGQPHLTPVESANPNLVEGRELYQPSAVALDPSVSPPIIYVSDTFNNRVLAWKNATGFSNGQPADLVVGQIDKYSTPRWGPGTNFSTLLNQPTGIAVDKAGNLYVADSGNNRVLRYPKPFAQTGQYAIPDQVIGQGSFTTKAANYTGAVSAQGISTSGFTANLTFDASGNLWLTDPGNRRVLEFQASDISSPGAGITAHLVIGQVDFVSQATPLNPSNSTSAADHQPVGRSWRRGSSTPRAMSTSPTPTTCPQALKSTGSWSSRRLSAMDKAPRASWA